MALMKLVFLLFLLFSAFFCIASPAAAATVLADAVAVDPDGGLAAPESAVAAAALSDVPPRAPDQLDEDLDRALDAGRTGGLLALSCSLVLLMVNLLKRPAAAELLWSRLPPSWRPVVPVVLGAAVSLAAGLLGVTTWEEAAAVALVSGFASTGLYEVGKYRPVPEAESELA